MHDVTMRDAAVGEGPLGGPRGGWARGGKRGRACGQVGGRLCAVAQAGPQAGHGLAAATQHNCGRNITRRCGRRDRTRRAGTAASARPGGGATRRQGSIEAGALVSWTEYKSHLFDLLEGACWSLLAESLRRSLKPSCGLGGPSPGRTLAFTLAQIASSKTLPKPVKRIRERVAV